MAQHSTGSQFTADYRLQSNKYTNLVAHTVLKRFARQFVTSWLTLATHIAGHCNKFYNLQSLKQQLNKQQLKFEDFRHS